MTKHVKYEDMKIIACKAELLFPKPLYTDNLIFIFGLSRRIQKATPTYNQKTAQQLKVLQAL